jgi:hypothetical protein
MNYIYVRIYCVATQKFAWLWPEITVTTVTEIATEVVVERFVTHPWLNVVSCTMDICICRVVARPKIITETELTTAEIMIIEVAIESFVTVTHPHDTAESLQQGGCLFRGLIRHRGRRKKGMCHSLSAAADTIMAVRRLYIVSNCSLPPESASLSFPIAIMSLPHTQTFNENIDYSRGINKVAAGIDIELLSFVQIVRFIEYKDICYFVSSSQSALVDLVLTYYSLDLL